jgi:hypothetical protein
MHVAPAATARTSGPRDRVLRLAAMALSGVLGLVACSDGSTGDEASGPSPSVTDPTGAPVDDSDGGAAGDLAAASDPVCPTEGEEWEVAKVYIEHNATDEDTGFHGFFGGEAWRELCLVDPNGSQIWLADPRGALGDLAVSDFFFESREPEHGEYSIADLKADFPVGAYVVSGTDYEGVPRIGRARFTHDIPAGPEIVAPPLGGDPDEEAPPTVPREGLVVEWEPVTETIDGTAVTITGYEVIVTDEDADDPDGWARPVYDVHVPAEQMFLPVPAEFLLPDRLYELEVLAIEASGNQTISVGFFRTE